MLRTLSPLRAGTARPQNEHCALRTCDDMTLSQGCTGSARAFVLPLVLAHAQPLAPGSDLKRAQPAGAALSELGELLAAALKLRALAEPAVPLALRGQ